MKSRRRARSFLPATLCLAPAAALLLLFTVAPIFRTFDMSFYTSYNYFKDIVYARGLGNYEYLLRDGEFRAAVKNTVVYVAAVLPISLALSLFLALLLNSGVRLKRLFQTIYFLPFVTSAAAVSLVWNWIYHSQYGLLNYALGLLGISPVPWLLSPRWSMVALVVLGVWKSLGYNIVIFLAGLQNIDARYLRAASADGAAPWQRTLKVTLPLLSPTIFFVSVVTLINSFKVFDLVYVLFGKQPGPLNSCLTMGYYIFEKFYNQSHYGIASAAVVALYALILTLGFLQLRFGKNRVHY